MPVLSYDYLEKWRKGDTFIETETYTGFTTMLAKGWGFKYIHTWNNVKRCCTLKTIKKINPSYEFEWLDGGVGDWQRYLTNNIIVAYIK